VFLIGINGSKRGCTSAHHFFRYQGIVRFEFIPQSQTVKGKGKVAPELFLNEHAVKA
jgi:hypothetical protein